MNFDAALGFRDSREESALRKTRIAWRAISSKHEDSRLRIRLASVNLRARDATAAAARRFTHCDTALREIAEIWRLCCPPRVLERSRKMKDRVSPFTFHTLSVLCSAVFHYVVSKARERNITLGIHHRSTSKCSLVLFRSNPTLHTLDLTA